MKPSTHPLVENSWKSLTLAAATTFILAASAQAADVIRSSAAGPLNTAGAWDGGLLPGSSDVGVWQLGSSFGSVGLGGDMSWAGLRITDLASSNLSISAGSTLTLGSEGIDLSASTTSDLTFSAIINLGVNQTWSVAAGRRIATSGNNAANTGLVGDGHLTLTGAGSFFLNSTNMTYSGGTTIDGTTVTIGSVTSFGSGAINIKNNSFIAADADNTSRTIASRINFTGTTNALTLGSTTISSRMVLTKGVDAGTAQRTINLVNTAAASTSNLALTVYAGVGEFSSAGTGGSLIFANGNPTPSTQPVWVLMGSTGGSDFMFNGALTIGSGVEAYFRSSNNLGAGTALTVAGTLDVSTKGTSAVNPTIGSLSGNGLITSGRTNAGTSTLTIDGGSSTGSTTFSGTIQNGAVSGALIAITKNGTSTQVLTGPNTYSGATTINAGALQGIDGTGLSSTSLLQLRGGVFQSSGTFTRALGTTAANPFVNWSTFSGGFAANGGVFNIQLNNGTGTLVWGGTTNFVQAAQELRFGSHTANNLVIFQNGINLGTTGTNTRVISVTDNENSTADVARISGVITSTGGTQNLEKTGDGVLDLTADNNYNGTTTVTAGTLLVNNIAGSATGAGAVTVASGASLGGSGIISGATTISGSLAPGNSIGTLTINNNVTWNWNVENEWVFELGTAGTGIGDPGTSDFLSIGGNFSKGTGTGFAFDFDGTGQAGWYRLASWTGTTGFSNDDFSATNLGGGLTGSFLVDSGSLYLNVIPEPSAALLLAMGFGLVFARRMKRRR